MLDLAVGKGHKKRALEKIKDTLAEEVHDDANVSPKDEAVAEMHALVAVVWVVELECLEHANLYLRCLSVLLHRSDNLDGHKLICALIPGFHHLAKGALAENSYDAV